MADYIEALIEEVADVIEQKDFSFTLMESEVETLGELYALARNQRNRERKSGFVER